MGMVEKYVEFVVNDIISKSRYDDSAIGGEIVAFPNDMGGVRLDMFNSGIGHFRKRYKRTYRNFTDGLESLYGVSPEEFEPIWDGITKKGLELWW
jgi:hypothetical protein